MACAMSSSSGRVSLRSYASSNGSAYSRMPPSSPSSGALCDWMVTSNPHYRSMSSCGQITRRRRYRSSSRSRKLEHIQENLEPIRIDTILAPTLFVLVVATIKALSRIIH
ncbi:hypothetical protein RRG08_029839 [Elysia crispata]|uniref:Uncharacterized protein n=1 Tax=Elysia crispata TaxID=231223 RepID=A0AAE1DJH4_9GAST|nr:hypothetical protein RRG08_029839 [Elysia crispata]